MDIKHNWSNKYSRVFKIDRVMRYLIIILVLLIGCAESDGRSRGHIAAPIHPSPQSDPCPLDGLDVIWWIGLAGGLNFENHSETVHHQRDDYWINETFIIVWNCSVDISIDAGVNKITHTFEDAGGWTLTNTEIQEPECACGG